MIPCAAALLFFEKKVLLILRSSLVLDYPSYWGLVGGKFELGEDENSACSREVLEEVGLRFFPGRLFYHCTFENRDCYYLLGNFEGEITLDWGEVEDFGWFSFEEAMKLPLAFNYKEVLELAHKEGLF